ncbi:unnamed protein product [Aphanomyces euteiches]|uniref:FYVE-type domain-containing protein n=2 Tax=Aphanomyces euteiches TaxID=100861 RepID=A0A6G0X964_9STRA|nr:hypothetical protein Ae201684_007442 [Aphanomyces euteiches]KAH9101041.1 hypothetical protein Ae201684P_007229 [Aphanomyces euteiches]KAH9155087.1 hypothetical protein AeRB84_002920 [Aphanomyces euteiches]
MLFRKRSGVLSVDPTTFNRCCTSQDHWVASRDQSECHGCARPFSLFRFKQHCHMCGEVVCGSCTRIVLLRSPTRERNAKVCVDCYAQELVNEYAMRVTASDLAVWRPSRGIPNGTRSDGQDCPRLSLQPPTPRVRLTSMASTSSDSNQADRVASVKSLCVEKSAPLLRRMMEVVASTFDCPMAFVSIVDDLAEWIPVQVGFHGLYLSKMNSLGMQVIWDRTPMTIHDADADSRFHSHPWVQGPLHVRYFVAAPVLHHNTGHVVGYVAIMDTEPRAVSSSRDAAKLTIIAKDVAAALDPAFWEAREPQNEATLLQLNWMDHEVGGIVTRFSARASIA